MDQIDSAINGVAINDLAMSSVTMNAVKIYTTPWCPYCIRAKQLLASKGVAFDDIDVSRDPNLRREMEMLSKRRTVPQIWIGQQHIGGCDELHALDRADKLETLLTDLVLAE